MTAAELHPPAAPEPFTLSITLGEHFDFRSIHGFKNLCNEQCTADVRVMVDMTQTRYVDSSGIALLHCLQHWIKAPAVEVHVINASVAVKRVLQCSRMVQRLHIH